MFGVLQMMYEDESLSILHLFGSESSTLVKGPSSLAQQFVPSPSVSRASNFSSADLKAALYNLDPSYRLSQS